MFSPLKKSPQEELIDMMNCDKKKKNGAFEVHSQLNNVI